MNVFRGKESNYNNLHFVSFKNELPCWISKWPPFKIYICDHFDLIVSQRTSGLHSSCVAKCLQPAVDNIDHNPSVTTSTDSFHDTGISLIQHPSYTGDGANWSIVDVKESGDVQSKTVSPL